MKIAGTWQLLVGHSFLGPEYERSEMPAIHFGDRVITLPDGSHPEFDHKTAAESPTGHATLSFDYVEDGEAPRFVRILIDAANSNFLFGKRYLSAAPLRSRPFSRRLPKGVSCEPIVLVRSAYLDRIEAEDRAHEALAAASNVPNLGSGYPGRRMHATGSTSLH